MFLIYLGSVVVHKGGSMSSGHYYAYVRSSAGPWVKMDDTFVSKVTLSSQKHQSVSVVQANFMHH